MHTWLQSIHEYIVGLGVDSTYTILGNSPSAYITMIVVFGCALGLFALLQHLLLGWLEKISSRTETDLDDVLLRMVRSFRPPFYAFLAFWLAFQCLLLTGLALTILNGVLLVWVVYQVVIVAGIFIEDVVFKRMARDRDETTQSALHLLTTIAKAIMWVVGFLMILSNFGVDITSLLAGAGIAGIAIAFALQGILSDLFSSFSLYFDKPFKVGDFIIVGTEMGTVKHIGIKSTRIQALSGELLTISNKELTSARIQNFTIMEQRRAVVSFGVAYETPIDKVRSIPGWIRELVENIEGARFDRAHFIGHGDSALLFEVVYFVLSPDYMQHMDILQLFNLGLLERFAQEGVTFAYPTQTVYVAGADQVTHRDRLSSSLETIQ